MSKSIPGTHVLDETFKKTTTAVAVPLHHPLALDFATKFMATPPRMACCAGLMTTMV